MKLLPQGILFQDHASLSSKAHPGEPGLETGRWWDGLCAPKVKGFLSFFSLSTLTTLGIWPKKTALISVCHSVLCLQYPLSFFCFYGLLLWHLKHETASPKTMKLGLEVQHRTAASTAI